ncbi:MAG: hypothetical protein ACI4K7_10820 [Oscillospiraceae bacterium]
MQTYEADMIDMTSSGENTPDLDSCCKKIMSSKLIIAKLLQAVVPEYTDSEPEDIVNMINNVSVSETPVDADIAPVIQSESTEDSSIMEGKRIYDIKFTARTPQDRQIALIINLEIQNNFNAGYPLIKRAEYYCARLISGQLNTIFTGSHYEKIEKVYSIWICTSPDEKHRNTISLYKMNRYDLAGKYTDTKQDILDYDLMNVIMVCLGDSHTNECRGIIRMLHSLLVAEIPASEKKRIVHEEYGIPINREFDKEVDVMCNISSLYINRGIEKGALKEKMSVILEMFKKDIPVQTIADVVHLSVEETEKIINDNT